MRFQNIYLQHRTEQQDPPDETDYVFEALLDQRFFFLELFCPNLEGEKSSNLLNSPVTQTRTINGSMPKRPSYMD
ncbi:Uncharacterized protein APZ42_025172 [Daphnia magna]|uniref:Uncharacterized protein n=1 Tax=Daphnia magna TaxID=35525 RepID=A0A164TDN8_9CRUS|nr:Uncharacterized protein APZ42_025172 [Daphnia magna]